MKAWLAGARFGSPFLDKDKTTGWRSAPIISVSPLGLKTAPASR
jgi:hypothetical protein